MECPSKSFVLGARFHFFGHVWLWYGKARHAKCKWRVVFSQRKLLNEQLVYSWNCAGSWKFPSQRIEPHGKHRPLSRRTSCDVRWWFGGGPEGPCTWQSAGSTPLIINWVASTSFAWACSLCSCFDSLITFRFGETKYFVLIFLIKFSSLENNTLVPDTIFSCYCNLNGH